jgi:hypothetical protein
MYRRYEVWYTDGKPYLRPGTENDRRWPDPGEVVTFTAHLANKGTIASGPFSFQWLIDNVEAASGIHASLSPGEEATETVQWAWAHTLDGERLLGQHTVGFVVDPDDTIGETYECNNHLTDRTDALSLVLAVTPDLYQALETPVDPQWPFSAEDWLQKQIVAMNQAFARSVYPAAPGGIEERVRLNKILVTSTAPPIDWEEDGGFYMTADDRLGGGYYNPATDISGGLLHELTHQLGIIDIYNLDVALEIPQVLDRNARPVQMELWATSLLPGLMGNPGIQPPTYDEHTTLALNANKGYRRGYYGEYLYDVPAQTSVHVRDNQGNPATGVTLNLYQRASGPNARGSKHGVIDNEPEISVATDDTGIAPLPNRSIGDPVATHTGHTLAGNPLGTIDVVGRNDEFLVEIRRGTHQEFRWLDITQLNLAAWRGETVLDIPSHVPPGDAPDPPAPLTGSLEFSQVALSWQPSPSANVVGYNVYRTDGPAYAFTRIVTRTTALSYEGPYDYGARAAGYAVTAVDSSERESGFSDLFWALRLQHPAGVVVDDNDQRIVLDPQNGYALLLQSPDGTVLDTLGSFDLHLENSWYIARAPTGRLLISHPGDWYSSRHSVRVTDQDANLLFEFGEQGTGPGQFQTPAGMAAWRNQETVRYLVADSGNHRIQAFDDNGTFVSAYGARGSGSGEFENPQGIAVDDQNHVIVADQGNDQLQVLSFDGSQLAFVRRITAALDGPTGVTTHGADYLIVADTGNNRVKVLVGEGDHVTEYEAPNDGHTGAFSQPRGVAVDSRGHIVVADAGNQRVVTILGAFPAQPLTAVEISGPTVGFTQTPQVFTAHVTPITSTPPITYAWRATGQLPMTRTGLISNSVTFTWAMTGTQSITVTASNRAGGVTDTHIIRINPGPKLYLPLVSRDRPK